MTDKTPLRGYPANCPACRSDMTGDEMSPEHREHYSPPYRWSRVLGISDGDSVFAWRCPDCAHEWLRGPGYAMRAYRAGWEPAE